MIESGRRIDAKALFEHGVEVREFLQRDHGDLRACRE
jgi:hypothetical protein